MRPRPLASRGSGAIVSFVVSHQPFPMQYTSTQGPQQRRSSSDQAEPSAKEGDSFGDMWSPDVPPLRTTVTMVPSWELWLCTEEAMLHCLGAVEPERTRRFEAWSKDSNFRAVLDPLHVARASLISCLPWKPLSSRVLKSVSARTALSASWLHSARVVKS